MNAISVALLSLFIGLWPITQGHADTQYEDVLLKKIITAYQLKPYQPKTVRFGSEEKLGRALFFDPILSGPQGVACASCHIRNIGSGDGLPLAVGLGAFGLSKERISQPDAFVIPRNTLPLFNRGSEEINSFFWDGRVQLGPDGSFESPLGELLPKGFDSLLAVASVFPIVEPDEMLGHSRRKVSPTKQHGDLVTIDGVDNHYQARALHVFENLIKRLANNEDISLSDTTKQYHKLISDAHPDIPIEDISIVDIGNALAAYIRAAFMLNAAPWDRYLQGEIGALSINQKRGAIVFYGKGRCAVCHRGEQFSDFRFHGLAIPQLRVGKHSPYQDYGRAIATGMSKDRYLFRTPTLRNVYETGPWGHNGSFTSIQKIIKHHINPITILYEAEVKDPAQGQFSGRILSARSKILSEIGILSDTDVDDLTLFMSSLSSSYTLSDQLAIPDEIPSRNTLAITK
ncbi:MAG: His-Xaa-Ser system-associated MauG-like protein [Candidatus Thiodiazotropha endolucinida]